MNCIKVKQNDPHHNTDQHRWRALKKIVTIVLTAAVGASTKTIPAIVATVVMVYRASIIVVVVEVTNFYLVIISQAIIYSFIIRKTSDWSWAWWR